MHGALAEIRPCGVYSVEFVWVCLHGVGAVTVTKQNRPGITTNAVKHAPPPPPLSVGPDDFETVCYAIYLCTLNRSGVQEWS